MGLSKMDKYLTDKNLGIAALLALVLMLLPWPYSDFIAELLMIVIAIGLLTR